MLKPGSGVYYFSRNSLDGAFEMQEGTLLAFDKAAEGSTAEYPAAQIAFLHPERVSYLSGSNWRAAFDRVSSVPYGTSESGRHYYSDRSADEDEWFLAQQEAAKTILALNERIALLESKTVEPSAEDLDAVAADDAAKQATSGEPAAMQETGDAFALPAIPDEVYVSTPVEELQKSNVRTMKPVKPKGSKS